MTEFFIDMIPPTTTAQQQKFAKTPSGRYVVYRPDKLLAARELLTLHLKPKRPKEPYTCGVKLTVRWQFPRGRRKPGYRITRPDTDNLQKMLKDVMTKVGFWKDDALVAVEHVEKVWSDRPGIHVEIEELEEIAQNGPRAQSHRAAENGGANKREIL